jgi:hypothetical protein
MKIEFRPDFHIRPIFKAIFPKLKELLVVLRQKTGNYPQMTKKMLLVIAIVTILIVVALLSARVL